MHARALRKSAPVEPPTAPQRETLDTIARMQRDNGMTPTIRELARLLGVSPTAIRQRLDGLEQKGLIIRLPRIARGLVIVQH